MNFIETWKRFLSSKEKGSPSKEPIKEKFIPSIKCPKCGAWRFELWWINGKKYHECNVCKFRI